MEKKITAEQLAAFEKDFAADPAKRVAQLAVTANGVNKSAGNPFARRKVRHQPVLDVCRAEHHAGGSNAQAEPGAF